MQLQVHDSTDYSKKSLCLQFEKNERKKEPNRVEDKYMYR